MEGGIPHCPCARGSYPRHPACTHSIPHRCRTSLARLVELVGIVVDVVPPALRAALLCSLFQVVWASRVEVLCYGGVAPVLALCFVFNLGDLQPAWAESKKHRRQQSSPPWAGSAGKPSLHGHGCAAGLKPSADVSARGRTQRSAACCFPLVVPVFPFHHSSETQS